MNVVGDCWFNMFSIVELIVINLFCMFDIFGLGWFDFIEN